MKNKQLFQELAAWQWEISRYQKTAFLIEERLDIIHKNASSAPARNTIKTDTLQSRIINHEKELDELERVLVTQKEILRESNESKEWQSRIEREQQAIRNRVSNEKTIFSSLKNDYQKVLSDILMKITK